MPARSANSKDGKSESDTGSGLFFPTEPRSRYPLVGALGIDASRAKLSGVVERFDAQRIARSHKEVENTAQGATDLCTWACHRAGCRPNQLRVVLEACGQHYVAAHTAHSLGCEVVEAHARRVYDFANAMGRLTKNDRIDATAIARFGLHGPTRVWHPPQPVVAELVALLGRRDDIERLLLADQTRRTACNGLPLLPSIERSLAETVTFLALENERIYGEIDRLLSHHRELAHQRELLMTIPGVGDALSLTLIAVFRSREFTSARQAAAYCGLVPLHKHSGDLSDTRGRIPRNCRRDIRRALYMPAMVAVRSHPPFKNLYESLIARGKHHNAAMTAVSHRLVRIAFGVLRNKKPYRVDWRLLSTEEQSQLSEHFTPKRPRRENAARLNRFADQMRRATSSVNSSDLPDREKGRQPCAEAQRDAMQLALSNRRIQPRWTVGDLKILRDGSGRRSTEELSEELRRSVWSIRVKASKLGISLRIRRGAEQRPRTNTR